jgi:hypothetical protein
VSKPDPSLPDWFLWFFQDGLRLLVAGCVGAILIAAVLAYVVDRRLNDIENQLHSQPPKSYTPPNLNDYRVSNPADVKAVQTQSVYVPVYSHVYFGQGRPCQLEATLSIRNTDPQRRLYIRSLRYYDTTGKLVKTPVDHLIQLGPLQTFEYVIPQRDSSGGSGANFLVDWEATEAINPPLIEAVMVGNAGTQGVSFLTRGVDLIPDDERNQAE